MTQTRVALVTGGGKGLGEAIAVALRAEGHKLVLVGRDETTLARVARETGGLPLVCDVTGAAALDGARARLEGLNPQKRILPPAHVGHIVARLTSEAASSVNGQAIPIDGGRVMK